MSTFYIPDHVLVDVLVKLPFDSLRQFRCVLKSWRDLISSSYFKEMHRTRSCGYKKVIALVNRSEFCTFDTDVENGYRGYKAIAKRLSMPADMELYQKKYLIKSVESCNGILHLSYQHSSDHFLWNPSTGVALHFEDGESTMKCDETAFGYDHLNDDYKLVKWRVTADWDAKYEVFVYSFKQKSWRTITDPCKLGLKAPLPDECTFVNGAMHWLVGPHIGHALILAFDLGTYKFQKISCPPIQPYEDGIWQKRYLSSFNGRLCICNNFLNIPKPQCVDIWVMKEYGAESSWTKIACIESRDSIKKPVVLYSEKKRKMMLQCYGEILRMYHLKTQTFKYVFIQVDGDMREDRYRHIIQQCTTCVCVESFVDPRLLL